MGVDDQVLPILTFQLRDQFYGLRIDDVVEVAAMVELIATPTDHPEVLGMANRHSEILPILDLRLLMGLPATPVDDRSLFIVVQVKDQMFGVVVDTINQVEYIPAYELRESTTSSNYIHGIITSKDRLVQVIAVEAILSIYLGKSVKPGEG